MNGEQEKTEQEQKQEQNQENKTPLVSLNQIFCSRQELHLFIVNNDGTKLKDIITEEVKQLESEEKLIDILLGRVNTAIDKEVLNDLRLFFKIRKQIGYNRNNQYDFLPVAKDELFYKPCFEIR